ncbi:MAG: TlpA family protein disulfide reductase [Proteobacteria bacterium]|nr:TlpA family protein disulfide reductase [Pseudomonadota bacterium]
MTGAKSLRIAAILGFSILCAMPAGAAKPTGPKVGDAPPVDELGKDASGNRIHLSDYRGKIVIISFWASWCGPCRKELPVLAAIQKSGTRDKIAVFAVNWRESRDRFFQIKRALKTEDLTLVSDESGRYGAKYAVDGIPHMIIIGRDGRIAAVHVGYGESEIPDLVNEINALWNKPTDSESSGGSLL